MSLDLHCLIIRNFKAFLAPQVIRLDNEPGLYSVSGMNNITLDPNGAAKSTIFDALAWVIYDKTLRDERPAASIEPWGGEQDTLVTLEFSHTARTRIMRGRNPNILKYSIKEKLHWSEPATCDQKKVSELWPLSFAAFRCTFVLPQFGEMFLDMRPEEQAQLFSETLELDLWWRAADQASALVRTAQAEIDADLPRLADIKGRLSAVHENIAYETKQSQTWQAERKTAIEAARETAAEARQALAELSIPPEMPSDAPRAAAEARLGALRAQDRAAYRSKMEIERQRDVLAAERDKSLTLFKSFEAKPEQCPTCGQVVSKVHLAGKIKQLRSEIKGLDDQINTLQMDIDNKTNNLSLMVGIIARAEANAVKAQQEYQDERERITADWVVYRAAKKLATDTRVNYNALLANKVNPHAARLKDLREQQHNLENESAMLSDEIAEAEWSVGTYKYWADAYRTIRLQLIDDVLMALEQATNKNAEELGLHGWLIEMRTERESATGKTLQGMSCLLYPPGLDRPVRWKSYCGGESQRWQLAVRFALSELLLTNAGVSPNIEILDEPTQHLSVAGVDDLLLSLRQRAERLGRQIWLVEHHVMESEHFVGNVWVEHNADGVQVTME